MRKVRTVQFASDDVLVFSEGIKYVHVVDLANKVRQGTLSHPAPHLLLIIS